MSRSGARPFVYFEGWDWNEYTSLQRVWFYNAVIWEKDYITAVGEVFEMKFT